MSNARGSWTTLPSSPVARNADERSRRRLARRSRSMRCPGGHSISVDGSDLDHGTRKVERELTKVLRRFK